MTGNDVNFSKARAIAAIKKFVPAATQLRAREIFPEFSQGLAAVFAMGGKARIIRAASGG